MGFERVLVPEGPKTQKWLRRGQKPKNGPAGAENQENRPRRGRKTGEIGPAGAENRENRSRGSQISRFFGFLGYLKTGIFRFLGPPETGGAVLNPPL